MATMKDVREGLAILAKYVKEDDYCLQAEHDVLYAGPQANDDGSDPLTPGDRAKMKALGGWHWDKSSLSWACFT